MPGHCLVLIVFSFDATNEDGRMGRLVNHARSGCANARVELVEIDGMPHLCLFAKRSIMAGEQILFDYGVKQLSFEDKVLPFRNPLSLFILYLFE